MRSRRLAVLLLLCGVPKSLGEQPVRQQEMAVFQHASQTTTAWHFQGFEVCRFLLACFQVVWNLVW